MSVELGGRYRRTSRPTGQMGIPHRLLGERTVILYDGAEAVHVRDPYTFQAETDYRGGDGRMWKTFVYCGPPAPLPGKYQEAVVEDFPFPGHRQFKITEHDPMSGRIREFQRSFSASHVAIFGIRRLWWHVRDEYVAYIFAPTYRAIE